MGTLLVFVIIPVGAVAVIGGLAYAGGQHDRRNRRYRPGRRYDFQPIWFLAAPERVNGGNPALSGHESHAIEQREQSAIGSGVIEDSSGARVLPGPTGGASDRW